MQLFIYVILKKVMKSQFELKLHMHPRIKKPILNKNNRILDENKLIICNNILAYYFK